MADRRLDKANDLDIDKIQSSIIDNYRNIDDAQRKDMREWYESLIDMMRREDVVKTGHLQINKNVVIALDDIHRRLLSDPKFAVIFRAVLSHFAYNCRIES